jgi:hypothetical protein
MTKETIEELEHSRAMFLVTMAMDLAGDYSEQQDWEAATIALLTSALEIAKSDVE